MESNDINLPGNWIKYLKEKNTGTRNTGSKR